MSLIVIDELNMVGHRVVSFGFVFIDLAAFLSHNGNTALVAPGS